MAILQASSHWEDMATSELGSMKIRGLGPKRLQVLANAGIHSPLDLLAHLPKDYRDFSQITKISMLQADQDAHICGRILSLRKGRTARKRIPILEGLIDDGSGSLRVMWFHQPYLANQLEKGSQWAFLGKVKREKLGLTMTNPRVHDPESDMNEHGLEVVYPQLGGLRSHDLANWIAQILNQLEWEPHLPQSLIHSMDLPPFLLAIKQIHQPDELVGENRLPRRYESVMRRLKTQEFYAFQLRLRKMVRASQTRKHARVTVSQKDIADFLKALPFQPTGDQTQVIDDIVASLNNGERLMALVQGDVGSGKTLIAMAVSYFFFKMGLQTAFMAPTTLLASQHSQTAHDFLEPLGVRLGLLSGDQGLAENRTVLAALKRGEIDLAIGTHKLFQGKVSIPNLGLVLIDEQHRFGVDQRGALLKKAAAPHYLAFSATPIPRSLALTLHGDFQVYQIREKPAHRKPIHTILKRTANRDEVLNFAKNRMQMGEAVYWVFPLIEGDGSRAEESAIAMHQSLTEKHFNPSSVGLVHGRLDRNQIAETMKAFRTERLQMLVATTVIEVGVDVPRASVMVIESAHLFGLSQLHQLRGRVGRGQRQAYCFLMAPGEASAESLKRLRLLEKCEDGFRIAEADLESRGAGHLMGKEQSGKSVFRFGDPWCDRSLMTKVRRAVKDEEKGCNKWVG